MCDYSFSKKGNMKKHVTAIHGGKNPFKCEICKKGFTRKISMTRHVASIHEKICMKIEHEKYELFLFK